MEDRKINEYESIEIISKMLKNARSNQRAQINCNILLTWGYVTLLISLLVWFLKGLNLFSHAALLWVIIPIICYPVSRYLSAKDNVPIKSYLDSIIDYISILFIAVCSSIAIISIITDFQVVLAIEGILFSIWAIIIGLLIKYKPIIIGGIVGVIAAHFLIFINGIDNQVPIFSIIVFISIIIPTHLFKRSITKSNNV